VRVRLITPSALPLLLAPAAAEALAAAVAREGTAACAWSFRAPPCKPNLFHCNSKLSDRTTLR